MVNSGGVTSFVEAGLRRTIPAAFRYSKKERMTESLKETVATLFLLCRKWSRQFSTFAGTTSVGCLPPTNWKKSATARRYARLVSSETDLLTKGVAERGSKRLGVMASIRQVLIRRYERALLRATYEPQSALNHGLMPFSS